MNKHQIVGLMNTVVDILLVGFIVYAKPGRFQTSLYIGYIIGKLIVYIRNNSKEEK